jgi:hypothetical protein
VVEGGSGDFTVKTLQRALAWVGTWGIAASVAALAVGPDRVQAGAKMADRTYSFTVKNTSGEEGRGFYIAVPGILPAQVDKTKSGGKTLTTVRVNPPPPGGTGVTIFFENRDKGIADDQEEIITLRLTGLGTTEKRFGGSGFRDKGDASGRPIGDVKFNPTHKVVGDPLFSLLNNEESPQDYLIQDLQFLDNAPELLDPSIALDFSTSLGFTPASPSAFTFPASDLESIIFSRPPVAEGNWLYARGRLSIGGVETGNFVFGQQYVAAVPEPSTLALAGLGIAAGLARWLRSRRRAG